MAHDSTSVNLKRVIFRMKFRKEEEEEEEEGEEEEGEEE